MATTIFVFGSNLKGIHGAGAAKEALDKHGAKLGQGVGIQGNSYAIPTKETPNSRLSLSEIKFHVEEFLDFARANPNLLFEVTPIGCGLAGYKPHQIAPFFFDSPGNVLLQKVFLDELD